MIIIHICIKFDEFQESSQIKYLVLNPHGMACKMGVTHWTSNWVKSWF